MNTICSAASANSRASVNRITKNTLLAMPTGKVSIRWATASATHAMPVMKPNSSAQETGSPKSSNTVLVNTTIIVALLVSMGCSAPF